MNRLQLVSTTFIVASLLSGCMQNRASEIKPSSQTKADFNKTSKAENNSTTLSYQNNSELDELISSAKENRGRSLDVGTSETPEETLDSSIEKDWVEISKEEELILTAQEFMGAKYVWAANGPECFDCSGFTRYVYKEHGITLPRYSGNQAKVGMKIGYDELQVGDLVFFDTEKKYRKKVNHVGIYIGDNKFIHASSAKKRVVITSFKKKSFYKHRFLWGQRVVNSGSYASL
jgi:cell wall-associated NlpC family hydrolase